MFSSKEESKNNFSRGTVNGMIMNLAREHAEQRHNKLKPKTIWKEILDLIYFCYEFVMVMAVIASGVIFPSIVT